MASNLPVMSQLDELLFFVRGRGLLQGGCWIVMKHLLLVFSLLSFSNANLGVKMLRREALVPSTVTLNLVDKPELILLVNLHSSHTRRLSHLRPNLAPSHSLDYYGHDKIYTLPSSPHLSEQDMERRKQVPASAGLQSSLHLQEISPSQHEPRTLPAGLSQAPLSSGISNCCAQNMVLKRGSHGCHCVYPIKLEIIFLNVSSSPNWNHFLDQFASVLGLRVSQIELINFYVVNISGLNISMYITPHTGVSFSASEAEAINSSLSMHRVYLDPALVGDYKLIRIAWFRPPALPQAPASAKSPTEKMPSSLYPPGVLVTSKKSRRPSIVVVIGLGVLILLIAVMTVVIICFCIYLKEKHSEPLKETVSKQRTAETVPVVGSLRHPTSTRFLTYDELKEATNNFESTSVLGEGGFGKVFKGVLSDGTAVAIKRLCSGGQQGDKEFSVEVEMLSRLHHRNLVKLVGYYSNRESSQNLLCYELVPNGTLESWLHGHLGLKCPLDWDTRMKIALDAARGLAYLHEDSQPCVIHRDFKTSNILLENNFHAKVSDFGLAKQAPEGRTNYLSTRVMGTFGYVAPEYAMTGHLLVKSDVYSYGVVLLELLTGRKPVDMSKPSGQENLVTWSRPILREKERLEEVADPKLNAKYPREDFFRVCTIAAACVAPDANQRPTMGEVVQSLKMVQRVTEYEDPVASYNTAPNNSSMTFESDGVSSIFSSSFSALDNDAVGVLSEDLHEGR